MVADAGGKKLSSLPFPAIVGQDELKRVLCAVAVNDGLDGALVVGEKGTAKSTAVRGLVDLLPDQRVVADCPYGCAPDDSSLQCADCRERDRDGEELLIETRPVPLVTLPLGATRDRVVGTLSVEDALAGAADFDPGLLARAHRGILYVDEVNLLDDHLVDVILDAAASGVNTVERDGISVSHPAEFTLIGTMNPEEGDLRPQLRDRFALQATVEGCREVDDRVQIIDRALESDGFGTENGTDEPDPWSEHADETAALREDLVAARERLSNVALPIDFKEEIAHLCLEAGVDGHRGDVATARTAMTIAALEGRTTVIESDVHEAARYALPHRLRSTPFEDEPDLEDLLEDRFEEGTPEDREDGEAGESDENESEADDGKDDGETGNESGGEGREDRSEPDSEDGDDGTDDSAGDADPETDDSGSERKPDDSNEPAGGSPAPSHAVSDADSERNDSSERDSDDNDGGDGDSDEEDEAQPLVPGQRRGEIADVGEARAPDLDSPDVESRRETKASGVRASTAPSVDNRGARVRTEPASGDGPIDAAASVRSAAARGDSTVEKRDLRQSVRAGETSATIVFTVDASASMRPAMRTAKGVVLELLRDSYEQRDQVAFVAFAGEEADVLLPPTDSVSLAARHLKELPSGDRTPLPAGLEVSRRVLERAETDASVVVLVTDGRANVADGSPTEATRQAARGLVAEDATVIVVDAGDDSRAGLSELVAAEADGELVDLSSLSVETVRAAADRAASDD